MIQLKKMSYKYIIVAWTINCNSCACLGKHFWYAINNKIVSIDLQQQK